jgi:anti-anti-sigma factor
MSSLEERNTTLFEVAEIHAPERVELHLTGELDLSSVEEFETAFDRVSREARSIVVDMSELGFIDSSGLRALIAISERPRLNGYRITFRGGPGVERALQITGLLHTLPFE